MDNQNDEHSFNKSKWKISKQVVFEFVCLAGFVAIISFVVYCHITTMLNDALEKSVAKSTRTIAYELNKQFNLELATLLSRARLVEEGKIEPDDLIKVLGVIPGSQVGIISPNGVPIVGKMPPEEIFWLAKNAYAGNPTIKYIRDIGLMFAVPVKINNRNQVLFTYYNDAAVRRKFSTISYNGDGTVILLNSMNDWTVIADGLSLINTHPDMDDGWKKLGDKLGYDSKDDSTWKNTGAVYYEFRGKPYFLYAAMVSQEHSFYISGYVPWISVAVGFESIYVVMIIAFGLVILFLAMVFRTIIKSRETKQLKHEKTLALQASQTKSDFLSNMSHEIRTPINAILGMDEMILRESEDKNILEYAENLRHAGNSLLGIVNDILDFSKIEAGKMEIICVEYDLGSLLNDLVNMIKPRADKKNLQIIVNADVNLPSVLYGDEIRIKQIITNILTNAIKYTEQGSVTLNVGFERVAENTVILNVSIVDTGIGIKDEDIEKLFHAFERIEEKRNRTIEGTGLGMNITQKLLSMMNSKLEVSSVYGEGSTFSFKLSQQVVNDKPLGDFNEAFKNSLANHEKYHEKFIAPDARILVVDDTVMNLTVIKGLLKQTKIQIDTAESGYDCLKLVMQKKYDMIFLDHRMPGMDGIETLNKMKSMVGNKNIHAPVISLTANAISGAREKYIAAGFNDYLTKPINSNALEELLIKYLPTELVKNPDEVPAVEEIPAEKSLPDWLKNIEGLDTAAGIEHCGGIEGYLDVLKVFAEAVNSGSAEIQNYFDNEDWKNYTTKVHALKSTAKVIGANELSEKAKRLEYAGNSGYIDEIKTFTPPLLSLYKSYAEKLAPFIENKSDDENKPEIGADELAEAFEALKEISASFDYDSLQFILNSLEDYKLPDAEKERFTQLKDAASKLDWEKIKSLVE